MNPIPFWLLDCKDGEKNLPLDKLGRFRWVSTSIVRFDPLADWPPDLCLRLVINPRLKTFDGMGLVGTAPVIPEYETRPLQMFVYSVLSKKALAVTGGNWRSNYCPNSMSFCFDECPTDGIVKLQFSHAVVPSQVLAALKFNKGATLRDWVAPCSAIQTKEGINTTNADMPVNCVAVMPRNLRSDGTLYQLTLRKSARVTALGGTGQVDQKAHLKGVFPFKFYFIQEAIPNDLTPSPRQNYYHQFNVELRPRYRRYRLYLRHGLQTLVAAADANQVRIVTTLPTSLL